MFEEYADGVNGFIETTEALPVEYAMLDESRKHGTPKDCLAVSRRGTSDGYMEAKRVGAKTVASSAHERAAELMPPVQKGEGDC
ncbi:hypothetical protein GBAR_LOCUS20331 [Geodia barretti]|uniref:Uncharacterized protein n=1 Tax=Geodia barretti TaxID=519541 RepID=A0AA35SU81_GEOBA|nr:hypothetical protein GBAR_LOCUS20331 [Geodia barretti]